MLLPNFLMYYIQQLSLQLKVYCFSIFQEKHLTILQEAIKKGITDADPDARSLARKAYWGFADHFKGQADVLLNSLEGVHRRMLQAGEMSNSSSSNSLNMTSGSSAMGTRSTLTMPRSRQSSVTSSQENLLDYFRYHLGGGCDLCSGVLHTFCCHS